MEIVNLFRAIKTTSYDLGNQSNTTFEAVKIYSENFPDLNDADIALIGLEEFGGSDQKVGLSRAPDAFRKAFYRLKRGSGPYKIVDLGNLVNGESLQKTYEIIGEVCRNLLENEILPILIGGSHDLDYGQFKSYEDLNKLITILSVDAQIDIGKPTLAQKELTANQNHLHHILMHEPNYLINYCHMGYQSFLVDTELLNILHKFSFETYRLGLVNQNIATMEPIIRAADMLSFDISSIKSIDAPGQPNAQPFGLTGQEACQICWYAGHSERLSSAGFYEFNPDLDDQQQTTASVLAVMVWYLIEGYYHRTYEEDFTGSDFIKILVPLSIHPEQIIFYKAKKNEKWWMEVPTSVSKEWGNRMTIVPCDSSDYEVAVQGEIPDRWIQTQAKY
ncbi:MAG: formimidoylglutamase [Cyclobacteriaceae bacterium]